MRQRQSCRGCIYQTRYGSEHKGCGYLLATGQQRNCPADKCDKKLTRSQIHDTTMAELRERAAIRRELKKAKETKKVKEFTGINSELKTLIQKANLTQKKVAKMVNMPYNSFVKKVTHGKGGNGTHTMHFSDAEKQRIADIFGVSADMIE